MAHTLCFTCSPLLQLSVGSLTTHICIAPHPSAVVWGLLLDLAVYHQAPPLLSL